MEFMDSEEELFPTQNCFLQEVLKRKFNTVCIIGEIGVDLESDLSDLQISLHGDLKEILFEEQNQARTDRSMETFSTPKNGFYIREFKI